MSWWTRVAEWMAPRAKAIASAAAPVVLLVVALGRDGLSWDDWELILTTGLAAAGVTYAVPNRPTDASKTKR